MSRNARGRHSARSRSFPTRRQDDSRFRCPRHEQLEDRRMLRKPKENQVEETVHGTNISPLLAESEPYRSLGSSWREASATPGHRGPFPMQPPAERVVALPLANHVRTASLGWSQSKFATQTDAASQRRCSRCGSRYHLWFAIQQSERWCSTHRDCLQK